MVVLEVVLVVVLEVVLEATLEALMVDRVALPGESEGLRLLLLLLLRRLDPEVPMRLLQRLLEQIVGNCEFLLTQVKCTCQ